MGRRSRKRRDPAEVAAERAARPAPAPSLGEAQPDRMKRGYARSEERNERIRQTLEPLRPGERPGAVTVAAIATVVLLLANLVLLAVGFEVDGRKPASGGVIIFSLLMLGMAYGLFRARYWAVLGFEALLAISLILALLGLTTASNLAAVALCLTIVVLGGWLFWKLVRAMARLQMPVR